MLVFSRLTKRPFFLPSVAAFVVGCLLGGLCENLRVSVVHKSDLMDGSSRLDKSVRLFEIVRDIGPYHFSPCSAKVDTLHYEISSSSPSPEKLRGLVASIAIDGVDCIDQLLKVARTNKCVGLSANQVGITWKMFAYKFGDQDFKVIINPKVLAAWGKATSKGEGCMSLPGERFDIKRSKYVKITGYINGEKVVLKEANFNAFILQHEMDHLNGKLIVDRVKK